MNREKQTVEEFVSDEKEDEERWQQAFDRSADALAQLAAEALEEHRAGRSQPLDADNL